MTDHVPHNLASSVCHDESIKLAFTRRVVFISVMTLHLVNEKKDWVPNSSFSLPLFHNPIGKYHFRNAE